MAREGARGSRYTHSSNNTPSLRNPPFFLVKKKKKDIMVEIF